MSSYNKLNGTYTSEMPALLTGVLRNDWGYKGLVMTDWFGGRDAVAQMNAGNDLLEPGTAVAAEERCSEALDSGELKMEVLDRNVERVLELHPEEPDVQEDGPFEQAGPRRARARSAGTPPRRAWCC